MSEEHRFNDAGPQQVMRTSTPAIEVSPIKRDERDVVR